jgi:hypothetical protein
MRRWTAGVAAALLVLEALVSGLVGLVLGDAVTRQNMSLGGLAPTAMAVGAWVGTGLLALFLAVVAVMLVLIAVRDRSMGRATRIPLIVCAVLHAMLAAVLLALSGVVPFVVLAVTLTLLVLLLFIPHEPGPGPAPEPTPPPALPSPAP